MGWRFPPSPKRERPTRGDHLFPTASLASIEDPIQTELNSRLSTQRTMSSSSLRIGSHFASCDDLLAAVRSATFLCEGSDVPIHAECTSRKTGNGKKITVRCKLGVRKPGRKRAGERIKDENEYCP